MKPLTVLALLTLTSTLALGAVLDPKIGPNIPIGFAQSNAPSSTRSQATVHLARSWSDPNLVIATFREGAQRDLGHTGIAGYAFSNNGGASWVPKTVLSTAALDQGAWQWMTFPVAA